MAKVHACTSCTMSPASTDEPYAVLGAPGQTAGSAQPITPAPELPQPAPVVALGVTEPDVSITEEEHDAISIKASWAAPTSPDQSFGPAFEELMQRSYRKHKASRQMENVSTLEGLKDVAAKHCNLLHVAGCYRYLQNLQDRDVLVQDFMKWYVCGRTRNSLERLKEGLKTLGVLDAIVAHPVLFANSFCWREEVLTSEQFSELFKISFSTAGSNKRRVEQ
ncbi:UNVERIFIED_CONTAM: hypothetical protein FKN15_069891 [Acipenser sinensis]